MNKRFLIVLASMVLVVSLSATCFQKDPNANLTEEQKILLEKGKQAEQAKLDKKKADVQAKKEKNEKLKKDLADAKAKKTAPAAQTTTSKADPAPAKSTTTTPASSTGQGVLTSTAKTAGGQTITIKAVPIPNGLTGFHEKGEYMGKNLTSVTIPNGTYLITERVFANNQLTSIVIPDGVTHIGGGNSDNGTGAFSHNQLTSVTLPGSVDYLGGFSYNRLTAITIPNGVGEIANHAFSHNQLTTVTLPPSVIRVSNGAFTDNQLSSISLGNVRDINAGAFRHNKLKQVTIPASVTGIGLQAFYDNPLESVTFQGNNVKMITTPAGAVEDLYPFHEGFSLKLAYETYGAGTYVLKKYGAVYEWEKQ